MPYCPECGIHYLQPNSTCVSCGRDLSEVSNSTDLNHETFGKTAPPDPPLEESIIEFNEFRPQVESQLGKGLIKPQSVEVEMDGFHFKYDQPPHKLVKSEALKDKIVEFRVTAPADPLEQLLEKRAEPGESFNENETAEPVKFSEESLTKESVPLELGDLSLAEEPAAEAPRVQFPALVEADESAKPEEPENPGEGEEVGAPALEPISSVEPEIEIELETKSLLENEPVSEFEGIETLHPPTVDDEGFVVPVDELAPEFPEPEFKILDEAETLWEGKGSWYGFGGKAQYRITNQSVMIVEPDSYRLTEFELALISEVQIKRTWLMKLLGVGDVAMTVRGMPDPGLMLKGIREPEKVKRLIEELI